MTEYYHIVPWFNSKEWNEVYLDIFPPQDSNNPSYEKALQMLSVWKARCPSLPSGIESTLGLLQVRVQDDKSDDDLSNDQLLRLGYSTAVMRFVNHMLDSEAAKGTTLYQAAKTLDIPDWIIDLRHDTAHNYNLPSLSLLREAAVISLKWLGVNYWQKHRITIQDYISGQKEIRNKENKYEALMHLCFSLSICAHPDCNITNMLDIPNASMKESIVNDMRDLFGDCIDFSNLKKVSIKSLINLVNVQSGKLLKNSGASKLINAALLGDESTFLSMDLVNFFCSVNFKKKGKVNGSYVQCFDMLLTFLHTHELLSEFTLDLIKITECETSGKEKATLAALWVAEILKALIKCRNFIQRTNQTNQDMACKKEKELKLLHRHWFPNEKNHGLMLNLRKPVPVDLTDINIVQPILSTYNPFLAHFAQYLLDLVDPKLPKSVIERVLRLTKLISAPDKFPVNITSKIYTEDDLKMTDEIVNLTEDIDLEQSEVTVIESDKDESNVIINTMWKTASQNHNWSACPIGLLPWHMNMEVDDTPI